MTITIGSFSCNALTAQPFGYEGEARTGLTARTFRISGLLTQVQWKALVDAYDAWRTSRIADPDTLSSGTTGTTVSLTISSTNGLSVTSLPCWFADAPTGEQAGPYINATALLVDAAQALAVLLRQQEKQRQNTEALVPSLGTVTLGSAVVTLLRPLDTRVDGPQVALTAGGTSYITGALAAHEQRVIEGHITTGTFSEVLAWYDTTIASAPSAGTWFPTSAPTATAEVIISGGVKSTRYTVSLTAVKVK